MDPEGPFRYLYYLETELLQQPYHNTVCYNTIHFGRTDPF